jgi:hypothetical protein
MMSRLDATQLEDYPFLMTSDPTLERLKQLVGSWMTEATHPKMPGVVVHGTALIEWLEGERFLILRSRTDHPDFPDAISIVGFTERDRADGSTDAQPLHMHYYDSRGVYRDYDTSIDDRAWRWERLAAGFSQRFTGTFADGGATIVGVSQLCEDDRNWHDDLRITYRRSKPAG